MTAKPYTFWDTLLMVCLSLAAAAFSAAVGFIFGAGLAAIVTWQF